MLLFGIATLQNIIAQNPTLSLPNVYLDVIPGNPFPLHIAPAGSGGYSGGVSIAPHNMYANAQGQPLVFSIEDKLYNKNGYKIASLLYDANSPVYSQSESIIVPDPGNCSRFYVIGSTKQDGVLKYFPVFSLVDMSQPTPGAPIGETGKVLITNSTGGNVKNLFD